MTSLVCWIGIDSRGPASIYLASDSRISWRQGPRSENLTWDQGRKIFACQNVPELFGYVGQVLFPTQILSKICDLADAGLLFEAEAAPARKQQVVFEAIREHFSSYPVDRESPFTIIYCTRESVGMRSQFHVATLSWYPGSDWHQELLPIPNTSGVVKAWGSGEAAVDRWYKRWLSTRQGGRTSRSVFSGFCDALASGEDSFTGGAPQLVGLYRQMAGQTFGIIYSGARYVFGWAVTDFALVSALDWRNALFERCDGSTMERLEGAQLHTQPRGLGKAL